MLTGKLPAKVDLDTVSTTRTPCEMERLVHIANEVDEELESFLLQGTRNR